MHTRAIQVANPTQFPKLTYTVSVGLPVRLPDLAGNFAQSQTSSHLGHTEFASLHASHSREHTGDRPANKPAQEAKDGVRNVISSRRMFL